MLGTTLENQDLLLFVDGIDLNTETEKITDGSE